MRGFGGTVQGVPALLTDEGLGLEWTDGGVRLRCRGAGIANDDGTLKKEAPAS